VAGESPQVYGSRCAATAWSHTIHQLQCSGSTLHDSPPQYLTPNPQRDPTQRPSDPLVPARSFEYISATAAANSRACSDSKRRQPTDRCADPKSSSHPPTPQRAASGIFLKHTRLPSKRDSQRGTIGCQRFSLYGSRAACKPLAFT
jgi:hypothetical protein